MEPLENSETNERSYYMVEIRFLLPNYIAEWFSMKGREVFKHRNVYLKDLMIAIYRREHGR